MPQLYLLYLSILPKNNNLNIEGDITGLLEVNVQVGCLIEIYAYIEAFGFARDMIGSTRRCTIVDKLILIVLKRITTPSLVSLEMFHARIFHNKDD